MRLNDAEDEIASYGDMMDAYDAIMLIMFGPRWWWG